MESLVLLNRIGDVAEIRFNRPEALNTINSDFAESFLEACKEAQSARAVVICGNGRAFMAGGELAAFQCPPESMAASVQSLLQPVSQGVSLLSNSNAPVIAAIHGAVAGAGFSIAMAADLVIAADATKLTLAYAKIGATPDVSGTWYLPRLVGVRKALELTLLSDVIDGTEALNLGLINRLVPMDQLMTVVHEIAQRLASGPTRAFGLTRRLLSQSFNNTLEEQLEAELQAFQECSSTVDFREGVESFLKKRQPKFVGF